LVVAGTACSSSKANLPAVKVKSTQAKAGGKKKLKKKKKKKSSQKRFERQCMSDRLNGCDSILERRLLDERVQREVSEHLALYEPLIKRIKKLVEAPGRAPDARVEGDIDLAEGDRNHEGPHAITLDVEIKYPRGLARHPRAKKIRSTFAEIKELNALLNASSAYHELSVEEIEEELIDLELKGKTSKNKIKVKIPEADEQIIISAEPSLGNLVTSLVATEKSLKYRIVHEWTTDLLPSFSISKSEGNIVIQEISGTTQSLQFTKTVGGEDLCQSLRGELRIQFAGMPRRKWAVDPVELYEEDEL
jgi:hypothetical protein